MKTRIQRIASFVLAAWRAGAEQQERCHLCRKPLTTEEVVACTECVTATSDQIIRERLDELSAAEAVGLARGIAIREGEKELARALQAVLLIHLTGGPLGSVAALAVPLDTLKAVN